MTFREKLKQEYPDCIDKNLKGGCKGCPCGYGYEKYAPKFCNSKEILDPVCTKCWDREMKENKMDNIDLHRKICGELNALYERKNADYGDSFHLSFQEEGMAMPRIRLGDKFNRFKILTRLKEGPMVNDESIRDTLIDLANYAIMTVMEIDRGDNANDIE